MANEKQNEFISSGVNRCRRCDRPLSDPNDIYGWCCAEILGLGNYQEATSALDGNELKLYNTYLDKYVLSDIKTTNSTPARKTSFLPTTDWKVASKIIARNATAIKNAGAYYGVNPAIIAACIYT